MSEGRQLISLSAQIEEAEKAFQARETDLVRQTNRGTIRPAVAQLHVARLRAALETLRWLQRNEAAIKAKVEGSTP